MGRFSGKRILITGGTSGMGLAGAKRIADEGGQVAVRMLQAVEGQARCLGHVRTGGEVRGCRSPELVGALSYLVFSIISARLHLGILPLLIAWSIHDRTRLIEDRRKI